MARCPTCGRPMPTSDVLLGVGTFNPGDGPTKDKAADLDRIAQIAHVIGCNEWGDRDNVTDRFLDTHPGWGVFVGDRAGAGKVPVFYDDVVKLDGEASRVVEAWRGGRVTVGAGPENAGPKILTHAAFTIPEAGRQAHVLNHHLIASHTRPTKRTHPDQVARKSVAALQAAAFEREADRCRGLVFGTGDWNADRRWVEGHVDGFEVDNRGRTFRRRQIDHVGHSPSPAVDVVSHRTLATSGSRKRRDHRAVVVTYRILAR